MANKKLNVKNVYLLKIYVFIAKRWRKKKANYIKYLSKNEDDKKSPQNCGLYKTKRISCSKFFF